MSEDNVNISEKDRDEWMICDKCTDLTCDGDCIYYQVNPLVTDSEPRGRYSATNTNPGYLRGRPLSPPYL